ncbi:helix-turn-helix domain-containing protein [Enterococcus sp. BWB1-3]|uniref:helix-turn-helix domain-containing protein n=1 Tax=unclassified Enterococcus TaxID=2608891 RepID=UPI001924790C|nr:MULTISPECIES: helix-turn-helix domain-containing protein [unclassified Enterococcus]MBL1230393.1 helix-turn-helix domain-containing protein [Enterococcus sp. BWB1-3]MCB5952350.1 helix-turn-helix domain-containing protein [Enterococcus sp. BWT-B8]MCB5955320.1 helix-turn-helix domain-containing protein [Enterococcus sp. CWB-B31]
MIHTYLEKKLLRAIDVIDLLFGSDYLSPAELSSKLNCTILTLEKDIAYLREELCIPVTEDKTGNLRIDPFIAGNQERLSKEVYSHSLFLRSLNFYLVPSDKKYIDFIDEHFISVSKGYQLRSDVEHFLKKIGLQLTDNHVTGDLSRIRFLISELDRQFGAELLVFDPIVTQKSNRILDHFELNMGICFSEYERTFFHSLMQTTVGEDLPKTPLIFSKEAIYSISKYTCPENFEEFVKQQFEPIWQERFNDEYKFTILALIVINTHIFDHTTNKEILAAYRENLISNSCFQKLLRLFTETFSVDYSNEDWFLSAVYIFLKGSTFNLHPMISIEYSKPNKIDPYFFNQIKQIVDKWNDCGLIITEKHLNALCSRLSPFILQKQANTIALITENSFDYHITKQAIQRFLPETIEFSTYTELTSEIIENDDVENTLFILDKRAPLAGSIESVKHFLFINFPPGIEELKEVLAFTLIK